VEKLELLHIAGRDIKWYNCFGTQFFFSILQHYHMAQQFHTDLLSISVDLPSGISYQENYIVFNLLPLGRRFLRLIHVVAYISTSIIFITAEYSRTWTDHSLFMHSQIDGYLNVGWGFCAIKML